MRLQPRTIPSVDPWVAGEMFESDPWLIARFGGELLHELEYPAAILGALLVLGLGYLIKSRRPDPAS